MRTRAFLGGALLMAVAVAGCKPTPKSDPTARRDDTAYLAAVNPASRTARPMGAIFDSVTISNEPGKIEISHASGAPTEGLDGQVHTLQRLQPGELLTGPNAAFRLISYGVGLPPQSQTNDSRGFPLAIYSPDGRKLSPAEMDAIGLKPWQRSYSSSEPDFPVIRFCFGETNRPPGKIRFAGIFDARTRKSLTSGSTYRSVSKHSPGDVSVEVQAWHPTPLELVMDVELDGEVIHEVAATPGTRHDLPGGTVWFAGVWAGDANSVGTSDKGGRKLVSIGISSGSGKDGASAVFLTDPAGYSVNIALLDAQGRVLPGYGGMSSGSFQAVRVEAEADAVRRVRFTVFTNHHRVVIPIPPLEGLPAANQGVRDLFQVRIPHADIKDEHELAILISHVTQMKHFALPANTFPKGYFPRHYTDVTPDDLLKDCGRVLGPSRIIVIDPEPQEIRVETPAWWKAWLWTKKKLGLK